MEYIKLFLKGIFIGAANVIPGVSGGTIVVAMGVYDRLIHVLNNFYRDFGKHILFLFPLGAGVFASILLFGRLAGYCLVNYSLPTNLFFSGIIAGGIPLIYKRTGERDKVNWAACAFGALIILGLALLKEETPRSAITDISPENAVVLIAVGMITSAAIVMPGVSGSLVLALLGYYGTFITAVSALNIPLLILIAVGVILGVLIISKIIDILLKKAYTVTYSAILGLITASLFSIFADKSTYATGASPLYAVLGVLLALAGFIASFKLSGKL